MDKQRMWKAKTAIKSHSIIHSVRIAALPIDKLSRKSEIETTTGKIISDVVPDLVMDSWALHSCTRWIASFDMAQELNPVMESCAQNLRCRKILAIVNAEI